MKRVPDEVELLPLSRQELHHRVIGVCSENPKLIITLLYMGVCLFVAYLPLSHT